MSLGESAVQRRQLILGVPAIWLGTNAVASSQQRSVDELLEELAARLAQKHGGTWVCKHDDDLLLMRKL